MVNDRLLHTVQGAFLGSLIVLGVMAILAWTASSECGNDANRSLKVAGGLLSLFCGLQGSVALMHYHQRKRVQEMQAGGV
ncbi:hypothetical protein HDU97_002948 [Phlyctochytrium planicorne]|nr:hypothetical protein HDU97_002948 [Phlyctochytrium planicorne]